MKLSDGVFGIAGLGVIFLYLFGVLLSLGVPVAIIYALYEAVLYMKRH